jgi:AraC-like DNA-binding protein
MRGVDKARDTFERVLDLLADALDNPDLTTQDLADSAYLSRTHFDRMVKAATGETPASLGRRLRLERAAFRLRAGGATILDVAVEAGYSSHEAFTRAFQRAYGVGPAAWRAADRRTELATPNGVHFHPPSGLVLPARTKVTDMDFLTGMVDHHIWVLGQLIDRAETLTDEQLEAPIEISVAGIDDQPTIRSVLSRLVGQLDMWNHARADLEYDFATERAESLASMRARLTSSGAGFAEHVRRVVDEGRLDETYVDTTGDRPYVFSAAAMIAHVLTYAAYRRTLVVGALASAGAADVEDDPLTWFGAGTSTT